MAQASLLAQNLPKPKPTSSAMLSHAEQRRAMALAMVLWLAVQEGGLLHQEAVARFPVCRETGWESAFVADFHEATAGGLLPFDDDARMLGPRCRALLSVFDLARRHLVPRGPSGSCGAQRLFPLALLALLWAAGARGHSALLHLRILFLRDEGFVEGPSDSEGVAPRTSDPTRRVKKKTASSRPQKKTLTMSSSTKKLK